MGSRRIALLLALALLACGCAAHRPPVRHFPPTASLPPIDFTVQVGAFSEMDNAIRLAQSLEQAGVDAYHFLGDDGLHRVRFGSFASRELAVARAEALVGDGVIDEYHVVAASHGSWSDRAGLRGDIVRSAMSFLGQPYRWGGADTAFDCSGLTMTAYRLNGLGLPRSSAQQYAVGSAIPEDRLREADLIFFATGRRDKPTHVGLYIGEGRFIHSPGSGKVVRIDALTEGYYQRHFLGARTYIEPGH